MARPTAAAARAETIRPTRHLAAGLGLALCLWLGLALAGRAADGVITSHGISTFGDLKYPAVSPISTMSTRKRRRVARSPNGPPAGSFR